MENKSGGILNIDKKGNYRIVWIDVARTIAILLVCLFHSISAIYKMNMNGWKALSTQSQIFMIAIFTISRLGVPLFLFISGKLLLSKKIETTEDCKRFYKKNLLPLFITTEIWNVLYNIFFMVINDKGLNIKELILNILFLKQVGMANMWYMPMILGIYLAIPLLSIIVKKVDFKILKYLILIVFLAEFLIPNIGSVTNLIFREQYNIVLNLKFFGGTYGIYIMLGYYIGSGKLKNIKSLYLRLIGIASFALTCFYQIWFYNNGKPYNVWYDFSGILIISICIFELLSRKKMNLKKWAEKTVTYISKISLGIFFVHIIVRNILLKVMSFDIINKPISVIILTIVEFIITLLIIYIVSRIKVIREKVLLIK